MSSESRALDKSLTKVTFSYQYFQNRKLYINVIQENCKSTLFKHYFNTDHFIQTLHLYCAFIKPLKTFDIIQALFLHYIISCIETLELPHHIPRPDPKINQHNAAELSKIRPETFPGRTISTQTATSRLNFSKTVRKRSLLSSVTIQCKFVNFI